MRGEEAEEWRFLAVEPRWVGVPGRRRRWFGPGSVGVERASQLGAGKGLREKQGPMDLGICLRGIATGVLKYNCPRLISFPADSEWSVRDRQGRMREELTASPTRMLRRKFRQIPHLAGDDDPTVPRRVVGGDLGRGQELGVGHGGAGMRKNRMSARCYTELRCRSPVFLTRWFVVPRSERTRDGRGEFLAIVVM